MSQEHSYKDGIGPEKEVWGGVPGKVKKTASEVNEIQGKEYLHKNDLKGLSKSEPIVTNEHGGKQSELPYRFDLFQGIAAKALFILAGVLSYGAKKYGDNNWHKISPKEHLNHALVHAFAWLRGDKQDDHAGHFLCRAFMFVAALQDSRWNEPVEEFPAATLGGRAARPGDIVWNPNQSKLFSKGEPTKNPYIPGSLAFKAFEEHGSNSPYSAGYQDYIGLGEVYLNPYPDASSASIAYATGWLAGRKDIQTLVGKL